MKFEVYETIRQIPDWNTLREDVFLSREYLGAKEKSLPENYAQYYVVVRKNGVLVAKAVCQLIEMKLGHFTQRRIIPKWLLNNLKINVLSFGNMFLTGNHIVEGESTAKDFFYTQSHEIAKKIQQHSQKKILAILYKDYEKKESSERKTQVKALNILRVQPNMVLNIHPAWERFQDYVSAMRAKYRTRVRRTFKKSSQVIFKEYAFNDIVENKAQLYSLFHTVAENASISTYQLTIEYFIELKRHLREEFKFYVGILEEKIVCFYTLIINKEEVETGFLGYNKQYLAQHELYLRMLYEMVEKTISLQKQKVVFSRTALEIKSSVGAEPVPMFILVFSNNIIINRFVNFLVSLFYKEENWEQRNVFKN